MRHWGRGGGGQSSRVNVRDTHQVPWNRDVFLPGFDFFTWRTAPTWNKIRCEIYFSSATEQKVVKVQRLQRIMLILPPRGTMQAHSSWEQLI